jgi:hypothetical protein
MVTISRGMVHVLGETYRIVHRGSWYEVVRVLDDRVVGAFRLARGLEVISGEAPEQLLLIARAALRGARLLWSSPRTQRFTLNAVVARLLAVLQEMVVAWLEPLVPAPRAIRTRAASPSGASGRMRRAQ